MSDEPAELTFRQVRVGDTYQVERTFAEEDLGAFARLSGDFSPLHIDDTYARTTPFGGRVVHGMLLASLFSQLVGMRIPGRHALYLGQDLAFRLPVLVGETVTALAKVQAKNAATRTITLTTEIRNARGKIAVSGSATVKLRDEEPVSDAEPQVTVPGTRAETRKVAVVTGGSRGIGAAIVRALGHHGIAVGVNYFQSKDAAEEVVRSVHEKGGNALAVQADVRERVDARRLIDSVADAFGGVDMLVNAATGPLISRPFEDLDWEAFAEHLDYQVRAVVATCQAAYRHMKARGGGSIVNIVSQVASGVPPAMLADYVTAKSAARGLSKALAVEWAPHGIRVNTVSPGLTRTELTQHYNERVFKMEAARTPLRRLATPEDTANATLYLLGEEASFLTGVDIAPTGGQVMA